MATDESLRVASWTNQPTEAISSSAVGRWQRELTAAQLEVFYRYRLPSSSRRLPGFAALPALGTADLLQALEYQPPRSARRPRQRWSSCWRRRGCFPAAPRRPWPAPRSTELVLEPELRQQLLAESQTALDLTTAQRDATRPICGKPARKSTSSRAACLPPCSGLAIWRVLYGNIRRGPWPRKPP